MQLRCLLLERNLLLRSHQPRQVPACLVAAAQASRWLSVAAEQCCCPECEGSSDFIIMEARPPPPLHIVPATCRPMGCP